MRLGLAADLGRIDEQLGLAARRHDREGQRHGVVRTSEPRMLSSQAIESGSVRITASSRRPSAAWPAVRRSCRSADLPAYFIGCGITGPRGGAGRSRPRRDRPGCFDSALSLMRLPASGSWPAPPWCRRVQPRDRSRRAARLQVLAEPIGELGLAGSAAPRRCACRLARRLHDIAPVDEHAAAVRRHHGQARPSRRSPSAISAARPRAAHIRPVLVGARHQHGIEPGLGHQPRSCSTRSRCVGARQRAIECLKHGDLHKLHRSTSQTAPLKPPPKGGDAFSKHLIRLGLWHA